MATYIVYAGTEDGYLTAGGTTNYSDAKSGVSPTVTGGNTLRVGQDKGTYYYVYESFFSFDTSSIPVSEIVGSVAIHLSLSADHGIGGNLIDVRAKSWAGPLTGSDWVPMTASYAALPLVGAAVPATLTTVSADVLAWYVNKGGSSRFVASSSRASLGYAPTGQEFADFYSAESGTSTAPVLVVQTLVPSTLVGVSRDSVQLSTGETVAIQSDGVATNATWTLGYYAKGSTTFTSIGQVFTGGSSFNGSNLGMERLSLCVDASDNIYVIGTYAGNNSTVLGQAFVKGVGLTWTAKNGISAALPSGYAGVHALSADWVPGTVNNSGGVIVYANRGIDTRQAPFRRVNIATLSASALLAGSGALLVASQHDQWWLSNPMGDGLSHLDVKNLPGAAVPTVCMINASTDTVNGSSFRAGTLQLSGTGNYVKAQGFSTNYGTSNLGAETRAQIVPISSTQWAVLAANSGALTVWLFDQNGTCTATVPMPTAATQPDFANSGAWTAYYDPTLGNLWVYYVDATNAQRIARVSFAVASLQWTATETTVSSIVGAGGSTNRVLRAVRANSDARYVEIEAANVSGGTLSTVAVTDTFNVAPNAPALGLVPTFDSTLASPSFTWTFSDPNPNDTQTQYEIEIDNNSTGASAYRSGVVTSSNMSVTLAPNVLSNNITYRWRVRTYDVQGAQGAFSSYSTFSTSATGTATITDPATDNQAGIVTSSYNVKWTYSTSGTATQSGYRLKMIRLSDSATLFDSGQVSSTSASALVTGVPTDTPVRLDLTVTNTNSQTTPVVSRYFTSSFSTPDQITNLYSNVLDSGRIDLTWALPIPTGSKPTGNTVDIYRSIDGGNRWVNIATVAAPAGYYADSTAPHGSVPIYILRENAITGYTWSNQSTADHTVNLQGVFLASATPADPIDPWYNWNFFAFTAPSTVDTTSLSATQLQFAGRAYPVTEFGQAQADDVQVQTTIPFQGNHLTSLDDGQSVSADTILNSPDWGLNALATSRTTVLFKDPRGRVVFGTISNLQVTDIDLGYDVQFTVNAVDYIEGPTVTAVGN